ncbi:hypothetical protein BOH78_4956 [Pichia kudriavzevii]|uniref:Uncharacterized protein n=1 Tax=Pichia kudriavzevii TaxID=4909 RepID=A0A1V2LBJ7_PICKU|nr:hypothetical protein BOH78_5453 [Pichia kudriavzevii]ONH70787.1 hypothetical protein BOH78_4956 [Pichia kudriavzevii]
MSLPYKCHIENRFSGFSARSEVSKSGYRAPPLSVCIYKGHIRGSLSIWRDYNESYDEFFIKSKLVKHKKVLSIQLLKGYYEFTKWDDPYGLPSNKIYKSLLRDLLQSSRYSEFTGYGTLESENSIVNPDRSLTWTYLARRYQAFSSKVNRNL